MMPFDEYFSSKTPGKYGVRWRGAAVNGIPKSEPEEPKKRTREAVKPVFNLDTDKSREDRLAQQFKDVTGL